MAHFVDKILSFFRRDTIVFPNISEKISTYEFADTLAWYVLRQIKENRDRAPNHQIRCFAQSVGASAGAETIDNEILFFLSFVISQICASQIDDQSYLDELIPHFYHVLASQRSSDPPIFESIARSRFEGYLEPYALDIKTMAQSGKGAISWKFMLSQLGKNLRSDFDRDQSDFVPAAIGLGEYFSVNMERVKNMLDELEFGKGNS